MEQQISSAAAQAEPKPSLEQWIEQEFRFAAPAMLRSVSATGLVKMRGPRGRKIIPKRGSIVASPELAGYDPDPDYFFHWLRDSAVVIDAVRVLIHEGVLGREATVHFSDFVSFSLELNRLSGSDLLSRGDFRDEMDPDFRQYARAQAQMTGLAGDRVLGDTRFNPDGTLDILNWSRPQHDGPATRALTVLRHWRPDVVDDPETRAAMSELLRADLDFIERRWREPSFDIWEEEPGHHYYTRLTHYAALRGGAAWMEALGEAKTAERYRAATRELFALLEQHWSPDQGIYTSRIEGETVSASKALDISVILAVLHAGLTSGPHSVLDPKVQATQERLEALFSAEYEINRTGEGRRAPAMGRYQGDTYYSGGAYFFSTFGAAEFYYQLADRLADGAALGRASENEAFLTRARAETGFSDEGDLARALATRGDAFMATARAYTTESGELSEQFDQRTGEQTSAKNLAWSYAAFITAYAARASALRRLAGKTPSPASV